MNTSAFDDALASALGDPIASGSGADGSVYTAADRTAAMVRAIKEYSRYRGLMKRSTVNVVAGTDTYNLPADFVKIDQESFDLAVGARASVVRQMSFYDAVYTNSLKTSGVGFGQRMSFGSGAFFGRTVPGVLGGSPEIVYRFVASATPSLIITPIPTSAVALTFFYYAFHTSDTVPEYDSEALLEFALYAGLTARAQALGEVGSFKEFDVEESPDKTMALYQKLAAGHLDQWNRLIVNRAYVSGG